jgi:hypothetical protein
LEAKSIPNGRNEINLGDEGDGLQKLKTKKLLHFPSNCVYINFVARYNVVFVYLNEYFPELCRLDSGGETSPKATFLATTLGLRRLFNFLTKAISNPKFSVSFLKKLILEIEKIYLNSWGYTKGKKPLFSGQDFDVASVYFLRKIPQRLGIFTQWIKKP